MDKKPSIPKKYAANSRRLTSIALCVIFLLGFFLLLKLANNKKNSYTQQVLSLPNLEKTPALPSNKTSTSVSTPSKAKDNEWQIVTPRSGDSMAIIFNRLGLSAKTLHEILQKNPHAKLLTAIKPSQRLQFLISKNQLEKLIIPVNHTQSLTVSRVGTTYKTHLDKLKTNSQNNYLTATVQGSLFNTAQKSNIPYKLIRQMSDILKKEVDFSRAVRTGDQFSMVYEAFYVDDKLVATGDILAVTYTNKGKSVQAIRYTHANGDHDYYTPKGQSLKKAFARYPIKFSHISSTFALSRYHPVLHYRRAHKGIDLAARLGTPIMATGDGVIETIGRDSGYGNMIKIRHDKTYSTVYGHMLRFQKGLSKGSRVKLGQVIGYVGQTGLATGPHCHYELHVHNQPRNPTTIPLPTAAPLSSREMASFKAKAGTLLAHLRLFEEAKLAAKGKKNIDVG